MVDIAKEGKRQRAIAFAILEIEATGESATRKEIISRTMVNGPYTEAESTTIFTDSYYSGLIKPRWRNDKEGKLRQVFFISEPFSKWVTGLFEKQRLQRKEANPQP